MSRNSNGGLTARVDRWLDHVFFAAWEVSVLVIPVLWVLVIAPNEAAVALSALAALAGSAAAVGTFRGEYLGSGGWPKPGHLATLPIRAAYYGSVLALTTYLGVAVQLASGSPWPGLIVPLVVCFAALAPLPRVLAALRHLARTRV